VRTVDVENKRVLVSQGEGLDLVGIPYDHLVFCLGKITSFATMPGVAEHALAMKDLSDAFRLRNHVLRCLELADIETDPARKRALLTFVVAGGGFSGVETIGELHELVARSLKYFSRIAPGEVHFALVHSGPRILPEMPDELGLAAQRILERRGVQLVLGARVRAASRERVYLADGSSIPTNAFVCTVGNAPNPVVKHTIAAGAFEEATIGGRGIGVFATDPMLRCVGRPGYWAVGDCAGVPNPRGDGLSPPTAQFAIREAKACAKNVIAAIDGRPMTRFSFKALGVLASLGQRSAVANVFGVKLTGFFAWFLWRTIYLMKLPGFARKLRVALDWTLDLLFPRDIAQLQVFQRRRVDVHHFEPGELIVRKGQVGREFYIILEGDVEVVGDEGLVVATLGKREVFGEKALLEDTLRTATVRARGCVDVLVMSRGDFRSIVPSFPVLDEYFAKLLRERHPEATASSTAARRIP
jgi:NADH dehydrogenase